MTTLYRIRRNGEGLYSTGGRNPRWKVKGKSWPSLAAVMSHLNQHVDLDCYARTESIDIPDSWQIVKFELTERELSHESAKEVFLKNSKTLVRFREKMKKKAALDNIKCSDCMSYAIDARSRVWCTYHAKQISYPKESPGCEHFERA